MQAAKIKQTEVMCIRVDHTLAAELRNEAEYVNISLNVLVNHIFRRYVEWDRDAGKLGFIPVTKELFASLMEKLDDAQLEQIAKDAVKNISDIVIYMQKRFDLQGVLQWLDELCKVSGFAKKHVTNNSLHTFIVQHDLGLKCSMYFKMVFEMIFGKLQKKIEPDVTSQSIAFTVDVED
ncbi:MAG TPA: hypothetical protein VI698_01875 [Nitrososphaerales archaeon]|nr:hypothetical protein [Nitrososphaerales archaeon]